MNQKGFVNVVLIIAVIVLIGAAGYFGLVRKSEPAAERSPAPFGETTNWKAYRNEMYGLELKHPASWSVMDKGEIIMSDEKSGSRITIHDFGTNLNFGDNPKPGQEMGLNQFMEVARGNDAFQNVKKTLLNGYTAYEIDYKGRISEDGGKTYREENEFAIMVENNKGRVFQIRFASHPTKNVLSSTELQILSTFKFIQ